MPNHGDQHGSWSNPFEEPKPRVAEWAAKEIATIASKLDKQLGPEYISSRTGPGGTKVHYLSAEKCISLANEVFGFNGWSSSIRDINVDFADENPQTQRSNIGVSVIVRVTLRDGTYHEDVGYGSIKNASDKAMAFEKAKKEGTTDGLKRALRNFGNVLGNCVYDKEFIRQVTKVKANPVHKFDEDRLHRHVDYAKKDVGKAEMPQAAPVQTAPPPTIKPEAAESFDDFLGELDEADFCVPGEGHPDEVVIPSGPAQTTAPSRPSSAMSAPANRQVQTPQPSNTRQMAPPEAIARPQLAPPSRPVTRQSVPNPPPGPEASSEPVAFFSARSVPQLPEGAASVCPAPNGHLFNPKAESPSIRKTPGIDHNSSKPVGRHGQHIPPTASQTQSTSNSSTFTPVRPGSGAGRGNVVNPNLDQTRRIGVPGGPGSPLANRSSYRAPTMKRPPLADLPANGGEGANPAGVDAKRQKT